MEPEIEPITEIVSLTDPHLTHLGIQIHPWVFGLDEWFESDKLMNNPNHECNNPMEAKGGFPLAIAMPGFCL